jgi:DNA repair exonuclease SbcCD nuclease subunit
MKMKPLSFIHVADIHLGYAQYGLAERREDFVKAFVEFIDKTIELKPDFVIMAGDIFDSPKPSNKTLATAVRELRRLREAGIKVFAVDGSHDMEPNVMVGTILNPLHNAGLLTYLPRVGSYEEENYYIYGIRSFRSLMEADNNIPHIFKEKPPKPNPSKFNLMVFHGALDDPKYYPPMFKPDLRVEHLPEGFQYYGGGHIHKPFKARFKTGIIVYPGSLETTAYDEAEFPKGFYHVKVKSLSEEPEVEHVKIESVRKFLVKEVSFTDKPFEEAMIEAEKQLAEIDVEGAVAVLVLKGKLQKGYKRSQVSISKLRSLAGKTLYTAIINQLIEAEEKIEAFKLREAKEIRTLAYQQLLKIFKVKHPGKEGEHMARFAIEILDPLLAKEEGKVEKLLEEAVES